LIGNWPSIVSDLTEYKEKFPSGSDDIMINFLQQKIMSAKKWVDQTSTKTQIIGSQAVARELAYRLTVDIMKHAVSKGVGIGITAASHGALAHAGYLADQAIKEALDKAVDKVLSVAIDKSAQALGEKLGGGKYPAMESLRTNCFLGLANQIYDRMPAEVQTAVDKYLALGKDADMVELIRRAADATKTPEAKSLLLNAGGEEHDMEPDEDL